MNTKIYGPCDVVIFISYAIFENEIFHSISFSIYLFLYQSFYLFIWLFNSSFIYSLIIKFAISPSFTYFIPVAKFLPHISIFSPFVPCCISFFFSLSSLFFFFFFSPIPILFFFLSFYLFHHILLSIFINNFLLPFARFIILSYIHSSLFLLA